MATIAERVLAELRAGPVDDDVLAELLGATSRQSVNQVTRRLAAEGRLQRVLGPGGKILNALPGHAAAITDQRPVGPDGALVSEDQVKQAVADYLTGLGCHDIDVAWGHTPGIDVRAVAPDGRTHIVEAKAEVASQQQQTNYFLQVLGEILQRMNDPDAMYWLALPDNRVYRGLASRLPQTARTRLGLGILWVRRNDDALVVEPEMSQAPRPAER